MYYDCEQCHLVEECAKAAAVVAAVGLALIAVAQREGQSVEGRETRKRNAEDGEGAAGETEEIGEEQGPKRRRGRGGRRGTTGKEAAVTAALLVLQTATAGGMDISTGATEVPMSWMPGNMVRTGILMILLMLGGWILLLDWNKLMHILHGNTTWTLWRRRPTPEVLARRRDSPKPGDHCWIAREDFDGEGRRDGGQEWVHVEIEQAPRGWEAPDPPQGETHCRELRTECKRVVHKGDLWREEEAEGAQEQEEDLWSPEELRGEWDGEKEGKRKRKKGRKRGKEKKEGEGGGKGRGEGGGKGKEGGKGEKGGKGKRREEKRGKG
eukprot:gene2516-2004_t